MNSLFLAHLSLHLSGDQSELHIIIFDEIDAICKVGDSKKSS